MALLLAVADDVLEDVGPIDRQAVPYAAGSRSCDRWRSLAATPNIKFSAGEQIGASRRSVFLGWPILTANKNAHVLTEVGRSHPR